MSQVIHQIDVSVSKRHGIRRRDVLRTLAATPLVAGAMSWTDVLNLKAAELKNEGMACILLWMNGGPSQFETFSPKPKHSNGGETQAIATATTGIQISENLPHVAKVSDELCIIRSLNGKEGSHPRATHLMQTGYIPSASIKYPTVGSNVAHQIGDIASQLPSFVRVGPGRGLVGAGYLGVDFDPFVVGDAARVPDNTALQTSKEQFRRRLGLMKKLDKNFRKKGGKDVAEDHRQLYDKASRMILSPKMSVFDISQEKPTVREAYGEGEFADGCILARRLVESGVTFVEVSLNGWDTHFDNFERSRELCGQFDQPMAALINDLKQRGMLERTLVLWMGEFGRTPRINGRSGRDHYPRAFNMAMAGAGVRGGQVIGKTDNGGNAITDRPVSVEDLFCTIFHALKIDPRHENFSSIGRPIKLVETGEVVQEVFG